jgi:hypothetical protein
MGRIKSPPIQFMFMYSSTHYSKRGQHTPFPIAFTRYKGHMSHNLCFCPSLRFSARSEGCSQPAFELDTQLPFPYYSVEKMYSYQIVILPSESQVSSFLPEEASFYQIKVRE